jgi:hypothetical protein
VSLLRTGAIACFVCGTSLLAALHDRTLNPAELCMVVGLPFESVFVPFVAIDPNCAMGAAPQ